MEEKLTKDDLEKFEENYGREYPYDLETEKAIQDETVKKLQAEILAMTGMTEKELAEAVRELQSQS